MHTSWHDFVEGVREYLTVDGVRKGSLTQRLIERLAKAAVLDLQSSIPSLKVHLEKGFLEEELVGVKQYGVDASSGDFVASASTVLTVHIESATGRRQLELTSPSNSDRLPRKGHSHFQCGVISFTDCKFEVVPPLKTGEKLLIRYRQEVSEFNPNDKVPYDERCTKLVGEYVKAHLSREIDKDLNLYNSYFQGYLREKALYYIDRKDYIPTCLSDENPVKYDSSEMSDDAVKVIAVENLFANDLIALSDQGAVRASSVDEQTSCDGYVKTDVVAGSDALVYFEGKLTSSGLTPGARYYLGAGKGSFVSSSPPAGISQFIGRAISDSEVNFEASDPIQL